MSELVASLDRVLLSQRGAVFSVPENNEEVIVLFSGGMDSVIASYMLIERLGCIVIPMYIQRGAKAEEAELSSAQRFVQDIRSRYPEKCAELVVTKAEYPAKSLKQYLPGEHKRTKGHPGRNMFLILTAAYYLCGLKSNNEKTRTVFIGNSPEDTFPHSSLAAVRSANIAVCVDQNDWDIQVTSPLFEPNLWGNVGKQQLVDYAHEHDINIHATHTCTTSSTACGECSECRVRLKYLR